MKVATANRPVHFNCRQLAEEVAEQDGVGRDGTSQEGTLKLEKQYSWCGCPL